MSARQPEYEAAWLQQLADAARRSYGVEIGPLLRMAAERDAAWDGPPDEFMDKDNCREGCEEEADAVNYALLETLARNHQGAGGHDHLFQAALHSAIADHHFRMASRET